MVTKGSVAAEPDTASDHSTSIGEYSAPPSPGPREIVSALKLDILASLKADILEVIGSEIKAALTEDLALIKGELQTVEVANGTMTLSRIGQG